MKRIYLVCAVVLVLLSSMPLSIGVHAQTSYHEAPMLADRVAAGELPPVEERLPINPLVVTPTEAIGTYGGTLRYPYIGSPDELQMVANWEYLTQWKIDMSGVEPNIAESIDVNEDATQYIIHLREGMKWSDGVPFTADDILFAINDIWLNPELNPVTPGDFLVQGQPLVAEKIDDYTLQITYPAPYGLLPETLAWWPARRFTPYPKHWLSQYHMAYNPDGVQQMLDEGVPDSPWRGPIEDWVDLFAHYSQYANDWTFADQSGRPTLGPWMVVQSRYEGDGHIILERNPYYWKVDTEGNQLPYIDRIEATGFEDYESMLLSVLEGNFDTLKDPGAEDRGLFMESQDISHLAIYNSPSDGAGSISIHINQTISDPTKAAIYGDRNFRIGMSYATNRQQIIDLIYNGNGTPRQIAPVESSPLYNEQLATQYLDYDLDLANQYLDMVIPDRDSDGYRLMPNGERMTVNFSVTDEYGMSYPLVAELLMQQWEQVGIGVTIEQITPDDRRARELDNSLEAMIYTAEGGVGINAILDARYFVPVNRSSYYASGWALWYLFGDTNEYAVEPPDTIKQIFAQYELVRGTADPERRIELMQELLQMSADEFFVMGVSNPQDRYGAINENIGNVPQTWYDGFIPGMQSITQHDQWYFKQ